MDNKTLNEEENDMSDKDDNDFDSDSGNNSSGKTSDAKEMLLSAYKRIQEAKDKIKKQRKASYVRQTKKANVKYIKPKKGNRIALSMVMTFIILGVSAVLSITILFLAKEVLGIEKSASSYTIQVPEGATVNDVIEIMTADQSAKHKEEIIKVPSAFKVLVRLKHSDGLFIHGPHTLRPDMGYSAIIDELCSEKNISRETVSITFEEGINLYDAAKRLEEYNVCAADKFIYYFNNGFDDYEFEKDIPKPTTLDLRFYRMEGYMFPDTYEFYVAEDIPTMDASEYDIIIRRIYDNFEEKYTKEIADKAAERGMTMDQLITLASMIQKEAANVDDMYNVSSVFKNRRDHSDEFPRLESDPTRDYAVDIIETLSDPLNESMVAAYNTYKSAGLPPGPICNPGLHAIDAALNPAETNYYYFCANPVTKEVFYAETLEQQEINQELAGLS